MEGWTADAVSRAIMQVGPWLAGGAAAVWLLSKLLDIWKASIERRPPRG